MLKRIYTSENKKSHWVHLPSIWYQIVVISCNFLSLVFIFRHFTSSIQFSIFFFFPCLCACVSVYVQVCNCIRAITFSIRLTIISVFCVLTTDFETIPVYRWFVECSTKIKQNGHKIIQIYFILENNNDFSFCRFGHKWFVRPRYLLCSHSPDIVHHKCKYHWYQVVIYAYTAQAASDQITRNRTE